MLDEERAFSTEFAKTLEAAGLYCIDCVGDKNEELWGKFDDYLHKCNFPGLAAKRFQKAYEIKDRLNLLTEEESLLIPQLNEVNDKLEPADQDKLWYAVHDRGDVKHFCLRPALWLEGKDVLKRELVEIQILEIGN